MAFDKVAWNLHYTFYTSGSAGHGIFIFIASARVWRTHLPGSQSENATAKANDGAALGYKARAPITVDETELL